MTEVKNFEFVTEKKAESIGHFTVNGARYDIRALKDTHVAYLVRAAQRKRNESAIISAVINFMEHALVEESALRFEDLVLGDPGLDLAQVVEIFTHVLDVVSAHSDDAEVPAKKSTRSRSGNPAVRAAG